MHFIPFSSCLQIYFKLKSNFIKSQGFANLHIAMRESTVGARYMKYI